MPLFFPNNVLFSDPFWIHPCLNYKCKQWKLIPKSVVSRPDLDEVKRQECFWIRALFLHVLDAISGRLLRVYDDSIHVLAQDFGDCDLVFLVGRLTEVYQSPILGGKYLY